MKNLLINKLKILLCSLFFLLFNHSWAQSSSDKKLFDSQEVIQLTLSGEIRAAINDRANNPKKHPVVLSFSKSDNSQVIIPVALQTRGNFRRMKENCNYPPLWIHFPESGEQLNSMFSEQSKMKLVMPCGSDEYVIREWLVYKLYSLISPLSFKARLVKVKLEDPKMKKQPEPFFAMLLEEEKQMALRNNLQAVKRKIKPQQTLIEPFLTMAVFEYLIGNTDWSVEFLHNVKLLAKDDLSLPATVPYDFDHSGIVSAPYAYPSESLQMNSIRERRYRGYCVQDLKLFDSVIDLFNSLKKDIYNVYNSCELLDAKHLKNTLQFLDEFYATINNTKVWQKEFSYPCDPYGTGNVVLKGLKEN